MTPILIGAGVGVVSGWINRGDYDQIQLPTSGKFIVIERTAEGAMFESTISHLPIITLAGDTKWVKVEYLEGNGPANVELI